MEDLLTFIFCTLAQKERAKIDEADAHPGQWYEVITNGGETLQCSDTLAGTVQDFSKYMNKFRFDEINIVITENRELPRQVFRLFSDAWLYSTIYDYFRHQEQLDGMRLEGEIIFPEDGSAPRFKKEYYNYGEDAEIFINEIAFSYFRHLICYIPDTGNEDNPEEGCTSRDFLEIAGGNRAIARHLFDEVTWEYPSTLYEQWKSSGALDELENLYSMMLTVYTFTDSGDFVHCNNCDKTMLLPYGADKCPFCRDEGALAWEDEDRQEATHEELSELGKYKMVVKNELQPQEYFSDFDVRREESEVAIEKILDANFWSSL